MTGGLKQDLRSHLVDIENQIKAIVAVANDEGIIAYEMRNPDGSWTLMPLLLAKAQTLNGLAALQAKEK